MLYDPFVCLVEHGVGRRFARSGRHDAGKFAVEIDRGWPSDVPAGPIPCASVREELVETGTHGSLETFAQVLGLGVATDNAVPDQHGETVVRVGRYEDVGPTELRDT